MVSISAKPFKDREDVKVEMRNCDRVGGFWSILGIVFAALGVISDAVNITLGLESLSWFLLAIVAVLTATMPHTRVVVAKHLFGIESEKKE